MRRGAVRHERERICFEHKELDLGSLGTYYIICSECIVKQEKTEDVLPHLSSNELFSDRFHLIC
jgi:hypothetical protein